MQRYSHNLTAQSGGYLIAAAGASVTVKDYPAGTVATIYSDDGVTPKTNPIVTGSEGDFFFYAADGRYTLEFSGGGYPDGSLVDITLDGIGDTDVDTLRSDLLDDDGVLFVGNAADKRDLASTAAGFGASLVGSENGRTVQERLDNPRAVPFGNASIKVLKCTMDGHYGFNSGILETDTAGKWVVVYRYGAEHGLSLGAQVWAADTYDEGQTLVNERIIYTDAAADTRNFVSGKMNGRIAIIATRIAAGAVYTDPVFIYSDDDGVTWSTDVVTAPSAAYPINFHGGIYPYPASAGGSDTNGFIAYTYGPTGPDLYKTVDNGANWTFVGALISNNGVWGASELAVQRVGTEDKWIMVMRTGTDNAAASISTDMTTWADAVDSGLYFDSNPPALMYHNEKMWFVGFSRSGRPIQADKPSHMMVASANAVDLFAANGNFATVGAAWEVVTAVPHWASGYMFPSKIGDRWFATFACGEQAPGGVSGPKSNMLCMIGDFLAITLNPYDAQKNIPRKNYISNGSFEAWISDSVTLSSTSTETAVGWFGQCAAGDTAAITRESFTPGQKEVPGNPSQYLQMEGTVITGANTHTLLTSPLGRASLLNGQKAVLSFRARMPAGAKTNIGRIRLIQTFGTGGSPSAAVSYSAASDFPVAATWQKYEIPIDVPEITGKTLGTNLDDTLQAAFLPIFGENATYQLDLCNVKLDQGPFASPVEPESANEVYAKQRPTGGGTPLVISGGVITVTKTTPVAIHWVDTEGASAADDIDTINGGFSGQVVVFRSTSGSRDPTFKDGTGNLFLAGDFTEGGTTSSITLMKDGTVWFELSRSTN